MAFRVPFRRRPARSASGSSAHALGRDASEAAARARVLPMLAREPVVWLSTVRPDGLPHLVPTWFWWDGESVLVFSKPGAVKVRNLRANPGLMLAIGRPQDDFTVGLVEARATVEPGPVKVPDAFFRKYASALAEARLVPETFRATYTQAIRIVPTRFVPWHGRGSRHEEPAVPARDIRLGMPLPA